MFRAKGNAKCVSYVESLARRSNFGPRSSSRRRSSASEQQRRAAVYKISGSAEKLTVAHRSSFPPPLPSCNGVHRHVLRSAPRSSSAVAGALRSRSDGSLLQILLFDTPPLIDKLKCEACLPLCSHASVVRCSILARRPPAWQPRGQLCQSSRRQQ